MLASGKLPPPTLHRCWPLPYLDADHMRLNVSRHLPTAAGGGLAIAGAAGYSREF
jgi:hypothetical protein